MVVDQPRRKRRTRVRYLPYSQRRKEKLARTSSKTNLEAEFKALTIRFGIFRYKAVDRPPLECLTILQRKRLGYWNFFVTISAGRCPQMRSISEYDRVQTLKNGFELVRGYF